MTSRSRCRSTQVELREPRVSAAGLPSRDRRRPTPTSAPRTRSARPTATSCGASAGEFANPPDVVAHPRDEADVGAVLVVVRGRRPGRDPLRRRHQRRRRRRAAGRRRLRRRRDHRPRRPGPGARGRRGLARGADPGRRARARRSRTSSADTASRCATSRSRSSSRPSAAGSPPGRAATSPPCYTHIDDLVESVRAITPSGEWESRRLPGSGAGPSPDRMLIGSEGTWGDHRGVGAPSGSARRHKLSLRRRVRRLRRRAPTPCASSPSRAFTRPTAACSTRPRPRSPVPARRGRRCSCSASSRHTIRWMRWMDLAVEAAREHGGEPGEHPTGSNW